MNINATALYQKINEHPAISARLSAISDQEELANEVVRLGEEFCLPVTLEEVSSYLVREQNAELSDDELEMVVGGKTGAKGDEDQDSYLHGTGGNDVLADGVGNDMLSGKGDADLLEGEDGEDQ